MKAPSKKLLRFWKNQKGSTAMIAGIAMPAMIGFGALAVDVGHFYSLKTNVQQAADIGALSILTHMRDKAQVNDLTVDQASAAYTEQTRLLANKNMPERANNLAVQEGDISFGKWDFKKKTFTTDATATPVNAVRIYGQMSKDRKNPIRTMFGKMFKSHLDLNVSTFAVLPVPDSFIMMSPDADGAFEMKNGADIDTLTIQVNSSSQEAFIAPASTQHIGAYSVNVVGGIVGPLDRIYTTGANTVSDFLTELPPINYHEMPCEETNHVLDGGGSHVLRPGRYCGGLTIVDVDEVTFEKDGIFIFDGGPLVINAAMRDRPVMGDGVLIYLADEAASVQIEGADLSLRAKQEGPYAGVAFMVAPDLSPAPNISFHSVSLYLAGIFYAPNSVVRQTHGNYKGTCGYVCFVGGSLKLDGTYVNVGPFRVGRIDPFGDAAQLPPSPPALLRTFRPHLLDTAAAKP